MIRIITLIKARIANTDTFQELPLVPASGTLRTDTSDTESGLQTKNSLMARLHSSAAALHDLLYNDLVIMLGFEDGSVAYVGTDDIPVRLNVSESDTLDISTEHISGAR